MTKPKASLRERTILAAEEHESAHYFNRDQKLSYIAGANHGPPIEFLIEALERIGQFGSSEGDTKVDPPRFKIAREALAEIRKARGDVTA